MKIGDFRDLGADELKQREKDLDDQLFRLRIQILPPRLMNRVIATRAASICRAVIQQGSSAFRP